MYFAAKSRKNHITALTFFRVIHFCFKVKHWKICIFQTFFFGPFLLHFLSYHVWEHNGLNTSNIHSSRRGFMPPICDPNFRWICRSQGFMRFESFGPTDHNGSEKFKRGRKCWEQVSKICICNSCMLPSSTDVWNIVAIWCVATFRHTFSKWLCPYRLPFKPILISTLVD